MQIIKLNTNSSESLASTLSLASESDRSHFRPFDFTELSIKAELQRAKLDCFYGIEVIDGRLAGFFMLRGLDEGYPSPMYGVFISPNHRGIGLGGLSLAYSKCLGKLMSWPSIKLKVDKTNLSAIRLYKKFGFIERVEKEQVFIMECDLV